MFRRTPNPLRDGSVAPSLQADSPLVRFSSSLQTAGRSAAAGSEPEDLVQGCPLRIDRPDTGVKSMDRTADPS